MSKTQDVDELFDVKNAFYIGNYQGCINDAQKLKFTNSALEDQRKVFLYRAYIAQRKFTVIKEELSGTISPVFEAVRMQADYYIYPQKRIEYVDILNAKLKEQGSVENDIQYIAAAMIFFLEGHFGSALKVLHDGDTLEVIALRIQILISIDRVELARKELKTMQEKDDDHTLTQLAQAWVNIATGGDKLQDAYYIYQDLIDKYGSTPYLLNGQAVSFIGQGKYEEAESALQEALEKDNNYSDTLINLIVLFQHTGKSTEVANRYFSQLKEQHPDHPYVIKYFEKQNEFERLCKQFAPSNPNPPTAVA